MSIALPCLCCAIKPLVSELVCLPNLSVGGVTIADQIVRLQRPLESGAFSTQQFAGILGSEFLRAFEITFDPNTTVFSEEVSRFRPDPFLRTTIGIRFARNDKDEFGDVALENSPADQAGIIIGDQIKAIKGEAVSPMRAEQVSARNSHGSDVTRITIAIERDGKPPVLELRSRQLLCRPTSERRREAKSRK